MTKFVCPIFERVPTTWEHIRNLGAFQFDALPSPGDRVHITHIAASYGIYRVLCIAHEPTREGEEIDIGAYRSIVYVEFLKVVD